MKVRYCILLLILTSSSLFGQTIVSESDGDWMDGDNWSTGEVPTASDDVEVNHQMTISSDNVTVKSLDINIDGSSTASVSISDGYTLTITNDLDMNTSNGDSENNELVIYEGGTVNVGGDLNVDISGSGNYTKIEVEGYSPGGVLNVNGDINITQDDAEYGELDVIENGTLTGANIFINKTDGDDDFTFTIDDNGLASFSGNMSLTHDGTSDYEIVIDVIGSATCSVGGNLLFSASDGGEIVIQLDESGTFKLGGTVSRGSPAYGSLESSESATFELNGSSAQILPETAGTGGDGFSYGILKINNTSGLTPAVTLENNAGGGAELDSSLVLENGQLYLNGEMIHLTCENPIVRTNGSLWSNSSNFSSGLQMTVGTSSLLFEFPFSNSSGAYIPVLFQGMSGDLGDVTITTYGTDASANPNNSPAPPGVTVSNTLTLADRFWDINLTGSGSASITFTYADADIGGQNNIAESGLQAQLWGGANWGAPAGVVDTSTNQVTLSGLSSFANTWTLKDASAPLSVELLYFCAEQEGSGVLLQWETANEVNNDFFTIEKSVDCTHWEVLDTLPGAGDSFVPVGYSFTDEHPFPGVNYYRLRQTDRDGTFTFSSLVRVFVETEQSWGIFPNPANEIIEISGLPVLTPITLRLTDVTGYSIVMEHPPGETIFDVHALQNGFYFAKIENRVLQVKPLLIRH